MTRSEIAAFFGSLGPNALYALCDQSLLDTYNLSLEHYVERCRRHGASLIQYRNKDADAAEVENTLLQLRSLWDGVLIINDHWQLARLCDGIHVGQEDLTRFGSSPKLAAVQLREKVGNDSIIGLSTHSVEEIGIANTLPIDYVGLGAYRSTQTKTDAQYLLGERLESIAAHSLHPVAAIGGIGFADRFERVAMRVMGSALFQAES